MKITFSIAGDQSLIVRFGDHIDLKTNESIRLLDDLLNQHQIKGIEETILGYTTLLIQYNPLYISVDDLKETIIHLIKDQKNAQIKKPSLVEIPILYGGEGGPDLEDVAAYNDLTPEEVIQIHSENIYNVYFLGFTPGFPFLGGMSEKIATPRLSNPRVKIQAGSVGIANNQTGIYPVSSPGGWRLIGHTPLPLYDPERKWPFLLEPGDQLVFKPIDEEEYKVMTRAINDGQYDLSKHKVLN